MGDADVLRYALGGVYFHRDGGEQIAVATNARRLVAATWGKEDAADVNAVVPRSACEQVIAMAMGTTNEVVMSANEGRVALAMKTSQCNTTLDVLPLAGRFPDYRSMFMGFRDKESMAVVLDVAVLEETLATFRRMGVEQVVLAVADYDSPVAITGENEEGVSVAGLLTPKSHRGDAVELGWMPGAPEASA
jgi:DNA polymerase III sliding clamp (beta) subunit (PCNA family)